MGSDRWRNALASVGLSLPRSKQNLAEPAEANGLPAKLAHEREKVAKLKLTLAARDDLVRALREETAGLEQKVSAAEREARIHRKNLRWIWSRYPGTEQQWRPDPQDPDAQFEDRARALKANFVDQLAAGEWAADDLRVTAVVTSCNRHDLLVRTLRSFFDANTHPIEKLIVVEDGERDLSDQDKAQFAPHPIEWINTGGRTGQIRAIDFAYARVSTPYIFHFEDDWDFLAPGFIERSMTILQAEPLCLQVWLRGGPGPNGHHIEDEVRTTAGVSWRRVAKGHIGVQHGFAFNPGLRRLRDYRVIGSSYSALVEPRLGGAPMAEAQLSDLYGSIGYFAAALWENDGQAFVRHTGHKRHVT